MRQNSLIVSKPLTNRITFFFFYGILTAIASIGAVGDNGPQANINGYWHINSICDNLDSFQYGSMPECFWQIEYDGQHISITRWGKPLPIKDFDFTGKRLQIITEEISTAYSVWYTTTYYDIYFGSNKDEAQGSWKSEACKGKNDPFKIRDYGSLALRRLGDKAPKTKSAESISIDRGTPEERSSEISRSENNGKRQRTKYDTENNYRSTPQIPLDPSDPNVQQLNRIFGDTSTPAPNTMAPSDSGISLPVQHLCPTCHGTKVFGKTSVPGYGLPGAVTEVDAPCPTCFGTGYVNY